MMIQNHEDKIWLPLELVIELKIRDKQRNSFVGTHFLQSATCEQQSIWSLDSKAMFGNFQDLDQNGSSALSAYYIPPASRTTVCIFTQILNPQGWFAINTLLKKAYTEHELHTSEYFW